MTVHVRQTDEICETVLTWRPPRHYDPESSTRLPLPKQNSSGEASGRLASKFCHSLKFRGIMLRAFLVASKLRQLAICALVRALAAAVGLLAAPSAQADPADFVHHADIPGID